MAITGQNKYRIETIASLDLLNTFNLVERSAVAIAVA
jgi:hypothetical protein